MQYKDTTFGRLYYREGTSDEWLFKEHRNIPVYYRLVSLRPDDIVLDIGANIGYTVLYASGEAKRVIGYEPEKENFKLLKKNCGHLSNVVLHNSFVTGDTRTENSVQMFVAKNFGSHSEYGKRGWEPVQTKSTSISEICKRYKPTFVKMDCEGTEYDIVPNGLLAYKPRVISMEAHISAKKIFGEQYPKLIEMLQHDYIVIEEPKTGYFMTYAIVTAVRKD